MLPVASDGTSRARRLARFRRDHEQRDRDRRGGGDDRRDQDVRERVRHRAGEERRVEHHDRPGDRRHAAGHRDEELRAAHRGDVGAHDERRFDHADEDVCRRRQADGPADAHRAHEQPREPAHEPRQDPPVEQQRRERAHDQHERQRAEREDERGGLGLLLERQRRAAEVAEHERGACPGRAVARADRAVEPKEELGEERHLERERRERERERHAGEHRAPWNRAPPLGDEARERVQREEAEQALDRETHPPSRGGRC
jgi:hypothetical protein